jgi:Tuberculosis necrotizing toxin/Pre-toxin domain with VENN motif
LEANYIAHKLAHALVGCVAGAAAGGNCQDGAIGAAVGEMVAGLLPPANKMFYTDAEKVKVLAYSKLVAGGISAYAGGNAQTAITTAEVAVQNNQFMMKALVRVLLAAAAGYTTGTGGGNPIEGITALGSGTDPLSQALSTGTVLGVTLSMQQWPAETTATLNFLATAGQAVDATISYVDSATGQVVSRNWNALSSDTQNFLVGSNKVVSVVMLPAAVAQLKMVLTAPIKIPMAKSLSISQLYKTELAGLRANSLIPNSVLQEIAMAEKAGWKNPDGTNLYPPLGGKMPGTIENVTLPPGTMLDRYGALKQDSSYLAPAGTLIEQRALPANADRTLLRYEVLKPLPVEQSKVLPFYGQPGMGTQFHTAATNGQLTIQKLVDLGFLKEVK